MNGLKVIALVGCFGTISNVCAKDSKSFLQDRIAQRLETATTLRSDAKKRYFEIKKEFAKKCRDFSDFEDGLNSEYKELNPTECARCQVLKSIRSIENARYYFFIEQENCLKAISALEDEDGEGALAELDSNDIEFASLLLQAEESKPWWNSFK